VDLISYLRPLRSYLLTVLLLSVLVGLGSALFVGRTSGEAYRATLAVSLPSFGGQAREVEQIAADFSEALTTPEVVEAASDASGIDADTLAETLTAERSSKAGTQVQISATGADPDSLTRSVAVAAREAYGTVSQPRLEAAESLEDQLQEAYEDAKASTAGRDADQQRWQSQLEFAALREANEARSARIELETTIATFEDAASPDAATVVPLDATWPAVQAGLTNGGATLFALAALLVAAEIWRPRPTPGRAAGPAAPAGSPGDDGVVGDGSVPAGAPGLEDGSRSTSTPSTTTPGPAATAQAPAGAPTGSAGS
jgi:hypothetical protein